MSTLDAVNGRYGRGTLRLAAEGTRKGWQIKHGQMSPGYTDRLGGIAQSLRWL